LLIDHLAGKSVNSDMQPVALFAFNDELWQIGGLWIGRNCRWIFSRLRDDIDPDIPEYRAG
jgi:hypothetical protein